LNDARRVLTQAGALGALSPLFAAAVHLPLIERFARGEFRESLFQAAEYPGVRLITRAEAENLWQTGEAVFFDARGLRLFEEGHVPRALNLPGVESTAALPVHLSEISRDITLVIYCEGGDCQSSLALARRLHDRGFRDIRVFTGGWEEWQKAGLPEEKGDGQK
jgi:rhodanese-related sulfurtransferase